MMPDLLSQAIAEHHPSHVFALFSGGHDSLCSTHLAAQHPAFSGVCHVNTGIGIEATREFVRDTCEQHGWPLLEYRPDQKTYADLVGELGMPSGTTAHATQYYWLKQRQIRRLVQDHLTHRRDRIALVTGLRVDESKRRRAAKIAVPIRRDRTTVWVNPILEWSAIDCNRYMAANRLERNQVTDVLHRSGECLCGALAHHTEIELIRRFYPDAAAEISRLEELARSRGLPSKWAFLPPTRPAGQLSMLELCSSCQQDHDA